MLEVKFKANIFGDNQTVLPFGRGKGRGRGTGTGRVFFLTNIGPTNSLFLF